MLYLLAILLLTWFLLTGLLWGVTQFGQGALYEEPVTQLYWRAPAAAGGVTALLLIWCLLNYMASTPEITDPPYPTLFSMTTEVTGDPVREFWVVKAGMPPVRYALRMSGGVHPVAEYFDENNAKFGAVQIRETETVILKENKEDVRFQAEAAQTGVMADEKRWVEEGGKRHLTPNGRVTTPRAGRSAMTVVLNLLHLGVWFLVLWLVLRFQWPHALGLAAATWVIMTFAGPTLFDKIPRKAAPALEPTRVSVGSTTWFVCDLSGRVQWSAHIVGQPEPESGGAAPLPERLAPG